MRYNPDNGLPPKSKQIVKARTWAILLMGGLLTVGRFASEVERVASLPHNLINYLYLALLCLTGLLVGYSMVITDQELDILFEWLDPEEYSPPSSLRETTTIVGLAAILVALLFAARDPVLYGGTFILYSLWNLLTVQHLNKELEIMIERSRTRLKSDLKEEGLSEAERSYRQSMVRLYQKGLDVLSHYFVDRPHLRRYGFNLAWSAVGLFVAMYARESGSQTAKSASYLVFLICLILSESFIIKWRQARDASLRPLKANVHEVKRAHQGGTSAEQER